jgi:hypothetical protein
MIDRYYGQTKLVRSNYDIITCRLSKHRGDSRGGFRRGVPTLIIICAARLTGRKNCQSVVHFQVSTDSGIYRVLTTPVP